MSATYTMQRSNPSWLSELRGQGAVQQMALEELRRCLLRGLRRAIRGADDAFIEDVAQEALVRILDRLEQFASRSRFETWAISIGIRIALDELRRRRWADVSLDDLLAAGAEHLLSGGQSAAPEPQAERSELVMQLYDIIRRQLTPKQRNALIAELKACPRPKSLATCTATATPSTS